MTLKLLVCVFFGITFLLFFYILESLQRKLNSKNEHGSARWSTRKEIKRNFKKERIANIKEIGFPITFDKRLKKVWFDMETPHWLFLGSTGSGKTVTIVIPMCTFIANALIKKSIFITDPKGEIYNLTSNMFYSNGYNIIVLDFRNPEKSDKINVLKSIISEYDKYIYYENLSSESLDEKEYLRSKSISHLAESNKMITSISNNIMKEKTSDPFWINMARQMLEGLISFFLEEYKMNRIQKEQITLPSIKKFQNSLMTESNLIKFKAYLTNKEYGSKSKNDLLPILNSSENTYKSIMSVFNEKMAIFDDIKVTNIISESNFELSELGMQPTALYCIVPDEDKNYYSLITLIVGVLYKELVKLALKQETQRIPVSTIFMLDEFANCPPFSDIESMVSISRSRGMSFYFFIQSFAQLDYVYGKDVAEIITDNCGLVYLKTNSLETAQKISRMLDKTTIQTKSLSESYNSSKINSSQSISLISRDLLTADEVKQLYHKMIIFPTQGHPIFRETILYNRFSIYKGGEYPRKVTNLKDLSYTYFTIEKLFLKENNNMIDKLNSLQNQNENSAIFDKLIQQIHELFDESHTISFGRKSGYYYLDVKFKDKINNKKLLKLKSILKDDNYYIDVLNGNTIEINVKI